MKEGKGWPFALIHLLLHSKYDFTTKLVSDPERETWLFFYLFLSYSRALFSFFLLFLISLFYRQGTAVGRVCSSHTAGRDGGFQHSYRPARLHAHAQHWHCLQSLWEGILPQTQGQDVRIYPAPGSPTDAQWQVFPQPWAFPNISGLWVAESNIFHRGVWSCFCGALSAVVWNFKVWSELIQQTLVILPGSLLPSVGVHPDGPCLLSCHVPHPWCPGLLSLVPSPGIPCPLSLYTWKFLSLAQTSYLHSLNTFIQHLLCTDAQLGFRNTAMSTEVYPEAPGPHHWLSGELQEEQALSRPSEGRIHVGTGPKLSSLRNSKNSVRVQKGDSGHPAHWLRTKSCLCHPASFLDWLYS